MAQMWYYKTIKKAQHCRIDTKRRQVKEHGACRSGKAIPKHDQKENGLKGEQMEYISSAYTDKGNVKKTNEDSLSVRIASLDQGQVLMAVVCDGVGGFAKGELASGMVIQGFDRWFENDLKRLMKAFTWQALEREWRSLINRLNDQIVDYGFDHRTTLGTTVAATLMFQQKALVLNVGDSRVYRIRESLEQLTKDQSLVQFEVDHGRLEVEDMEKDPRRNLLLQCVGAKRILHPALTMETVEANRIWFLCSDGFRHTLTEKEIVQALSLKKLKTTETMRKQLSKLVKKVKSRKERDNISVIAIKTIAMQGGDDGQ